MADRDQLIKDLQQHGVSHGRESLSRDRMISFIESVDDCFFRTHLAGHVTGSGMLVSADGTRVLLNHHKFLNIGFVLAVMPMAKKMYWAWHFVKRRRNPVSMIFACCLMVQSKSIVA